MVVNLSNRIALWLLETEATNLEYFKKVDVGRALTLKALRFTL